MYTNQLTIAHLVDTFVGLDLTTRPNLAQHRIVFCLWPLVCSPTTASLVRHGRVSRVGDNHYSRIMSMGVFMPPASFFTFISTILSTGQARRVRPLSSSGEAREPAVALVHT